MSEPEHTPLSLLNKAVQSCELLRLAQDIESEVREPLDEGFLKLCVAKHLLEEKTGAQVDWQPPLPDLKCSDRTALERIRQLRLTYQGDSIPVEAKEELVSAIRVLLEEDRCQRELFFLGIHICPWYSISQQEPGQKCKYNRLMAVYRTPEQYFWSAENPHVKTETAVQELEGVLLIEVTHYLRHLARGQVQYVENLLLPDVSVLYENELWHELRTSADIRGLLVRLPGFLAQCKGQAVGGITKKSKKTGQLRLAEQMATYQRLCESLRLCAHLDCILKGEELLLDENRLKNYENNLSEQGRTCLQNLLKDEEQLDKEMLLQNILQWSKHVESQFSSNKKEGQNIVNKTQNIIGKWNTQVRKSIVRDWTVFSEEENRVIQDILEPLGGFASSLLTSTDSRLVVVARAGSFMYNLHTETSDTDYILVYINSAKYLLQQDIFKSGTSSECHEDRGPLKIIEYGAYEARVFAEMLAKGSVVMLELIFATCTGDGYNPEFISPEFRELCEQVAQSLVNENSVRQFLGLVRNNLRHLRNERNIADPAKECKMLYQIFYKLFSVESLARGEIPVVHLSENSEERQRILQVRRAHQVEDEQDWLDRRAKMIQEAEDAYSVAKLRLAKRPSRLREEVDHRLLTAWLMRSRGLDIQYPSN